nr:flagellar transcriptional regulator FlhD [Kosakonia arachidis]
MKVTSYDVSLQSIYVFNLSYLLLAQRLIKNDSFSAGLFLGIIDEDLLDVIKGLSLPQLIQLASGDRLVCQLRIDNESVLKCVTKKSRLEALQGIHTGIILSTSVMNSLTINEQSAK